MSARQRAVVLAAEQQLVEVLVLVGEAFAALGLGRASRSSHLAEGGDVVGADHRSTRLVDQPDLEHAADLAHLVDVAERDLPRP